MFWDTHAHVNMLEDPNTTILSFPEHGIFGCICPAVDYASSIASIQLANRFPGIVGACIGIHPNEKDHPWNDFLQLAAASDLWAIGETGLDYYRDEVPKAVQKERFIRHIELAKETGLPLIIHVRQSADDVLALLKEYAHNITCILHSFTESTATAERALDLGCYISFSGIVTFKNAQSLRQTAQYIPIDRILIETDTPYLTPEPFRGKINHPKHVAEVAKVIAHLHQIPLDRFAQQILSNTQSVFTKIT